MKYRLLALDIDGTLVNAHDEVASSTRESLQTARERGVHIVLATGRRYSQAVHLAELLGLDSPLVTSSGALTKVPSTHQTLHKASFVPGTLEVAIAILEERGLSPVVLADTFCEGFDYYVAADVYGKSSLLDEFLSANNWSERYWNDFRASLPCGVFAAFTMGTQAEMAQLEQILHSRLPGKLTTNVLRSPRYCGFFCEIMPAGTTKWAAIQRIAAQQGIVAEEICAIGDDINDLSMIREAGLGIAMGNAPPEVQEAADRVVPTQEEGGLQTALRLILGL